MAFEQEIRVVIDADDSGLIESFEQTNSKIEETNDSANQLNQTLDQTFQARKIDVSSNLDTTTNSLKKQDVQVKKNTKSFGRFNRGAARGVSALSRFTGAGGSVTRSLAGVGLSLAATPFGAFAIAASAASIAYSFFAEKLGANNDEIVKKNNELRDSIASLEADLAAGFREGKLIQLELDDLEEGEKRLKEIAIRSETIGKLQVALNESISEQEKLKTRTAANETERLELTKQIKEADLEQNKIAQQIAKEKLKIRDIDKQAEDAAKKASEDRKKRELDTQKLFDSLIRDELQKRLLAIEREREARNKRAEDIIGKGKKLNDFIKRSDKIAAEDSAKVVAQFDDAKLKAKRELLSKLAADEEAAAKLGAQNEFEARKTAIEGLDVLDAERAELVKQNEAKLQQNITDITNEFAEKRKQEQLKKDSELFELELASAEAKIQRDQANLEKAQELERQEFSQQARTEEEITAFKKSQDNEKLKAEISYQIERLKIAREFNKQLTEEEKAALDAQIETLKTRLSGVGAEIKQEVDSGQAKGLGGLLGLTDEQVSNAKAIQGALEQVTQAVSSAVAERIRLLDEEINKRNDNIENLEDDLDREIRLAELGKAANVRNLQEQIAAEKAERDKAEQQKKEAAKAQFALDTALQTSNLITAISSLYSSLSGIGFGAGVALATALSAVLIGSFVASKAQAASVSGFKKGGYTGDGNPNIIAGPAHKGEFYFDADTTRELGLNKASNVDEGKAILANHFSDSDIPNSKNIKKANKRINKALSRNAEQAKQERLRVIGLAFKEEFKNQNSILHKQLKAIQEIPETVQIAPNKIRIKRGNKTEFITLNNK